MPGLLSDANVQGHAQRVLQLLIEMNLWPVLAALKIEFASFADVRLAQDASDREIWSLCQEQGWVLFTDNRNHDGPESLEAILRDLWRPGNLPVLTLADKHRFEVDANYRSRTAEDTADLLFGIFEQQDYRDLRRIYLPRERISS